VVLLASVGPGRMEVGPAAQGPKVPGPNVHHQVGPAAQGPSAQRQHGTLGFDLGGRTRLSKPRGLKIVDEVMWAAAMQLAIKEMAAQYGIEGDVEQYYSTMCRVGQQAVAEVTHNKTQSIYDVRCAQRLSQARRKCQPVVAA